jgi:hypothetical protein
MSPNQKASLVDELGATGCITGVSQFVLLCCLVLDGGSAVYSSLCLSVCLFVKEVLIGGGAGMCGDGANDCGALKAAYVRPLPIFLQ